MTVSISRAPVTGRKITRADFNAGLALGGAAGNLLAFKGDGTPIEIPYVTPQMFGAVGDGVTNDGAAFLAALDFLAEAGKNKVSWYNGSNQLFIPAGAYYLGTTTLDITHSLRIEGAGHGMEGGQASKLIWAANTTGIRIQRYNTSGATAIDEVTHGGGDGTTIRGLQLRGGYVGAGGDYYGIQLRARAHVSDCYISHFQGNGIHIVAGAGDASIEGNTNNFSVCRVSVKHCNNGIYTEGADANAGLVLLAECSHNRGWGVYDSSFLGNTYVGCHADANGSGPYKSDNVNAANVFLGCYAESGQPNSSIAAPALMLGGLQGAPVDGPRVYQGVNGFTSKGSFVTLDSFIGSGFAHRLGPISGTATDNVVEIANTQAFNTFNFKSYGSPNKTDGVVASWRNAAGGLIFVGNPCVYVKSGSAVSGSTLLATFDTAGVNLESGLGYKVGGTKVVGAQGAAVADATDAASAITQLNAVLSRLRAHGLIAT